MARPFDEEGRVRLPGGSTRVRVPAVLLAVVLLGGCAFPRDAGGTLDTIRSSGRLRLGVVEARPWVVHDDDAWSGVEVQVARELAAEVGAELTFVEGTQDELLEALEKHALDMVAAGLTDSDPWASRVTFTPPLAETRLVVAAEDAAPVDDIAGARVAVERGSVAEALVRMAGADPDPVASLPAHPDGLVALEDWRVAPMGLTATGHVLLTESHVLAVPTGENAWLTTVQDFLDAHLGQVRRLLEEGSP